jgi:hypothetical protein
MLNCSTTRHAGAKERGDIAPTHSKWGELLASQLGRALPPRKDPGTHGIGGCLGFTAGLDTEA